MELKDIGKLLVWLCVETGSATLEDVEMKVLRTSLMESLSNYGLAEFKHMVGLYKERKLSIKPVEDSKYFKVSGVFIEDLKTGYRDFRGPAEKEIKALQEDNEPKKVDKRLAEKESYEKLDKFCEENEKLPTTWNWTLAFDYASRQKMLEYDREEVIKKVIEQEREEASNAQTPNERKAMHNAIDRLKNKEIQAKAKTFVIKQYFQQKHFLL